MFGFGFKTNLLTQIISSCDRVKSLNTSVLDLTSQKISDQGQGPWLKGHSYSSASSFSNTIHSWSTVSPNCYCKAIWVHGWPSSALPGITWYKIRVRQRRKKGYFNDKEVVKATDTNWAAFLPAFVCTIKRTLLKLQTLPASLPQF